MRWTQHNISLWCNIEVKLNPESDNVTYYCCLSMYLNKHFIKGAGGLHVTTDHGNWFCGDFCKSRVRSTRCYLRHQKIFILAEVIAGQRSMHMCSIAYMWFLIVICRKSLFLKLRDSLDTQAMRWCSSKMKSSEQILAW